MLIIFYFVLLLVLKHHTLGLNFETKTAAVGEDVTLTCHHQMSASGSNTLFWIRFISGNMPEALGGAYNFDRSVIIQNSHFTLKKEPGVFLLHINKTQFSDIGVYFCLSVVHPLTMEFLKGTLLSIKEPDNNITAVVRVPPSNPVDPGDPVTLQCSVLSDNTESQNCPEYHRVYWFRAESNGSNPSLISTHGASSHECENGPEALSPPKCVFNFCKNVSSSDAGIYYCAVSTCAQVLFGRGTKLDKEAPCTSVTLLLLCATLTLSLIVNALFIYFIKKQSSDCCKETVAVGKNHQTQQSDENSLVYSVPTFTRRNAGKAERGNGNAAEEETIYTKVRASPRP